MPFAAIRYASLWIQCSTSSYFRRYRNRSITCPGFIRLISGSDSPAISPQLTT